MTPTVGVLCAVRVDLSLVKQCALLCDRIDILAQNVTSILPAPVGLDLSSFHAEIEWLADRDILSIRPGNGEADTPSAKALDSLFEDARWWAHFVFTRMNTAPIILRNQIEGGMDVLTAARVEVTT